jgi:hypothetical protein
MVSSNLMGEKCGNVPNGELPSLRREDISWRPPYSDAIPSWKDISTLAHTLDSMHRLTSNPLLWHPENGEEKVFGGKIRGEVESVYGEYYRSLMLACHVYWRERRQPQLYDWFRRVLGLHAPMSYSFRAPQILFGAELRTRLWLESTAWEYSHCVRRILEVFDCSINDIDPSFWRASIDYTHATGPHPFIIRDGPEFREPPEGYWNMVDTLLDSMPINRGMGFVDERGVLLRWMHLHGQRPTEDTLMNVWKCVETKRGSFLMPY